MSTIDRGSGRILIFSLFISGFLYYCILPAGFLMLAGDSVVSSIAMQNYREYDNCVKIFLCLAVVFSVSFSFGYYILSANRGVQQADFPPSSMSWLWFVSFAYILMAIGTIDFAEIVSPPGYLEDYNVIHRGQLTTLFLTSIWWHVFFKSGTNSKIMIFVAIVAGLNLLALGSRLGLITGFISFIILKTQAKRKNDAVPVGNVKFFRSLRIIVFFFVVTAAMGLIGLLRANDQVSIEGVFDILLSEAMFIFVSFPAYYENSELPLFAVPYDVIAAAIGAIPSALFPEKVILFEQLGAIDSDTRSSFGGVNHIIAIIANFGLVGFPIVAFVEGAWFGFMAKNLNGTRFMRAVAVCSLALLPFVYFREGYQTSLKLLLFNFYSFPYAVIFIIFAIKSFLPRSEVYSK